MEFLHLFPERTRGYCLFHSTCFADSEEKRENRDREISLVLCGKKLQIIRTNIPKGFSEANIEKMADKVEWARRLAAANPDEGIIALLQGMKQRRDHSDLLGRTSPPPLIIWGRGDNYIGEEVFNKLVGLAPHATVVVLKNSGHMGFIEEPDCAYSGMFNYLASLK
jgi:pimeloyl-ACP methyl ester carboxylesterase